MTGLSRPRLALLALLPLLLMANKCRQSDGGAVPASITNAKWVLQTLNGKAVEMPDGVDRPWLQLTGDQLSGFNGCNQIMGGFQLDVKEQRIGFPSLGSTKKYCAETADLEKNLMTALRQVDGYDLKDGDLNLLGGGKELMRFTR